MEKALLEKWMKTPQKLESHEVYDILVGYNIDSPAAVVLGDLHVVGRWVSTGEVAPRCKTILRATTQAVEVLGEGASWDEALTAFKRRTVGLPSFSL